MASSKLMLPPEKLAQRHAEFEALVRSLPEMVATHKVDALLLPGDLWDHESFGSSGQLSQFRVLYNTLCQMEIPVVITPGNHDYYSTSSFYHPQVLALNDFPAWPSHITIFTSPRFESKDLPGWEGQVQLTGKAFFDNIEFYQDTGSARYERVLSGLEPNAPAEVLRILQFHGSRDDANRFEEKIAAPFSKQELLALNYDYAAVGHYHRYDTFTDSTDVVRGAYAGSPFARGMDETGERYGILGELIKDGTGLAEARIQPLVLDPRKIVHLSVQLGQIQSLEELQTQVIADLAMKAQPQDMVYLALQGRIPPGLAVDWEALEKSWGQSLFHLRLDHDQVTLSYDIQCFLEDPYSLEGRYIQAIQNAIATAPAEEKTILEQALYMGLDALTQREILVR